MFGKEFGIDGSSGDVENLELKYIYLFL